MRQPVGGQSERGKLRRVAVKHRATRSATPPQSIASGATMRYLARPEVTAATASTSASSRCSKRPASRRYASRSIHGGLDSLSNVRDASIVWRGRRNPLQHGKPAAAHRARPPRRRPSARPDPDPRPHHRRRDREGGDVCWIDERTLAVGRGYRTNDAGIRQLRELVQTRGRGRSGAPAPLARPGRRSSISCRWWSPIGPRLVPRLRAAHPVPFREARSPAASSFDEVADSGSQRWGATSWQSRPREVLMVAGNPETHARLEPPASPCTSSAVGEICLKGGGGPTCLTRPLMRDRR